VKTFLTNSLYIKKKYPDFIFLKDIFSWTVKENKNGYMDFFSKKKVFDTIEPPLVSIISPSDYRLIYDILTIDPNSIFYKPEDFSFGKRKRFLFNKKSVQNEFFKYMKRSYLSYLNYSELSSLGLKRIEQFVMLMSIQSFNSFKEYDNILLRDYGRILSIKKVKEEKIIIDNINLSKFIYVLNKELSFSFEDISKYLLKLHGELIISDPFLESGFKFLKEDNSEIYDIYSEIIGTHKIDIYEAIIEFDSGKKQKIFIKKGNVSKNVSNYLLLQNENYFEGKNLHSEKIYPNLVLLYNSLSFIMPFRDFFMTLRLLLKMKKIKENKMSFYIEEDFIKKMQIKKNLGWLNRNIWKEIYSNQDFLFGSIVDPINCSSIEFVCPECGNRDYLITPQKVFCRDKKCSFRFNRVNLKSFGVPKISILEVIQSLNSESILLKKSNGSSLPVFLNSKNSYYYLYIS
jgi:hypothetical protein